MKKVFKYVLLTILVISFNVKNIKAKEEVKFFKCVDGDTIKVLIKDKEYTVRMLAIDTPESVSPKVDVQYYGVEASNYTCQMVSAAKKLELEYDANSDKEDKYGRVLAYVFVDDYLLQSLLVEKGYAEVAYLYGDYKYTPLLQDKQAVAQASKIGIWNDEAKEAYNKKALKEESTDLTFKEIILVIGVMVALYIYKKIEKKIKKKVKKIKKNLDL